MWRGAVAVAALGGARAATCAEKDPYSEEPNPWGWPLSPSDWSFGEEACWTEKFAMCGGGAQSPVDFGSCSGNAQTGSTVTPMTAYHTLVAPVVKVSKYMRSLMVEGDLGRLNLNRDGIDRTLTATSVHVVAPAMHHMNAVDAVAEVFVVHKDEAANNTEHKFVVTSTLLVDGPGSPLLAALGAHAGEDSWTAASTNFQQVLPPAGAFLSYHGSMPVPPCWETVTWLVSKEPATASAAQVDALGAVLEAATGSATGRPTTSIACSRVGDTVMPDLPGMEPHSCAALAEEELLTSQCWAELGTCDKSPVALPPAELATLGDDWEPMAHAHYKVVKTVTAKPSKYTLDFTTADDDFFGYLDIHGWQFVATEIKVKAISMHTLHDKIYAGELIIVHDLMGDRLATSGPMHQVMISIPLEIGTPSPMLQALGMDISNYEAVRHGNGYTQLGDFDLGQLLAPTFADGAAWYWYSGGPALDPGTACPAWGARWLVAGKPMSVSATQLNSLALQVSGMDSSQATVATPSIWQGSLPAFAVDKDGSACDVSVEHGVSYSYDFVSCWPKFELPVNECGSTAATGRSPIDINTASAVDPHPEYPDDFLSRVNWKPMAGLTVDVHNHASFTVSTLSQRLGYAMLYDKKEGGFPGYYQITNLTLHMPSEHTVDGKHFEGEFQVHMSKQFTDFDLATDDALAASFFFELGEHGSVLLEQLLHAATDAEHGHAMQGTLDLMQALGPAMDPASGGDFYSYSGGFTTPDLGCAGVVKWLIFTSPMSMDQSQVDAFRALVPSPGNNRPIQDVSPPVYKNSFQEGTLPKYDFYLSRTDGRDRVKKDTGMILLPVFGSIMLAVFVMFATFVHQGIKTKKNKAGGLMEEGTAIGSTSNIL
nr:carbonic anhydrase [Prorocentrum minimum]